MGPRGTQLKVAQTVLLETRCDRLSGTSEFGECRAILAKLGPQSCLKHARLGPERFHLARTRLGSKSPSFSRSLVGFARCGPNLANSVQSESMMAHCPQCAGTKSLVEVIAPKFGRGRTHTCCRTRMPPGQLASTSTGTCHIQRETVPILAEGVQIWPKPAQI